MSEQVSEKPDAAAEYEHVPAPAAARRSLLSVAAVWAGFSMCLGNTAFGGLIVYSRGMIRGLSAIVLGNLLLFGYVGAASDGGSFLGLLTGLGPVLACVAVLFVFANLGSVAAHSLHNGAMGWSGIIPLRMRRALRCCSAWSAP